MDEAREPAPLLACQEATAATATAAAASGVRPVRRALVVKSRKSNRLFQVNRLASELVECLAEFLASKNVINRAERYAKICEGDQGAVGPACQLKSQRAARASRLDGRPGLATVARVVTIDLRQQSPTCKGAHLRDGRQQEEPSEELRPAESANRKSGACGRRPRPRPAQVKKFNQNVNWPTLAQHASSGLNKKRSVSSLLADLLSGRCREGRLCLVAKLLRAPVVLAALFSLSLAVSLFILYTLSFHRCQLLARGPESPLAANHQHGFGAWSLTTATTATTTMRLAQVNGLGADGDAGGPHHINSRQLGLAKAKANASSTTATDGRPLAARLFRSECGVHEGRAEGGAWAVTGVAYASPPVGARRWRKPRPIWRDAELCDRSGGGKAARSTRPDHCVQFSPFNHRVSGSEDCLYLDIYTPMAGGGGGGNKSAEALPVMVYIHGGFLVFGSSNGGRDDDDRANWMRARPSGQLASELNVVLVAPNYRLQALGFMALRGLAQDNGPDGSEGNYGLWDQLIALRWIRRNIGAFGGNPANVLVFGPDAASALPLALVSQRRPGALELGELGELHEDEDEHEHEHEHQDALEGRPLADLPRPPIDLSAGGLFRSVWLMNPTIYYELPYELANQHYARLGWSQSACSRARARDSLRADSSASGGDGDGGDGGERPPRATATTSAAVAGASSRERSLIACLMNLTGEQIVREYLGRDQPAFRLDDENSLPIRSIFPDQFVTLDGKLVQDSYPFTRHTGGGGGGALPEASGQRTGGRGGAHKVNFLVGSTAQAVEYWPCPRNLHAWSWLDFRHYVATSLNSFSQPQGDTLRRASELYGVPGERAELESTGDALAAAAAAAGLSDNNSDNNNNNKSAAAPSPMGVYLTMVSDIRQVCPSHELARSLRQNARVDALERYVVEWRPSAQLSASLRMATGEAAPAAEPGGVECPNCAEAAAKREPPGPPPPPPPPPPPLPEAKWGAAPAEAETNLQYAFHYWDLLALFGFEFDAQLEPSEGDLEFQRHIRAMAKRVAWQGQAELAASGQGSLSDVTAEPNGQRAPNEGRQARGADRFVLFALDNTVRRKEATRLFLDETQHKERECRMWRQTLKQSYAWIS